jgi:hypothetical protein
MKIYLALTIASLKMYFRNRQALFWAIFGIMNFDGYNSPDVGIYDAADNEASHALIQALQGSQEQELLSVTTDSLNELHHELEFGNSRAVIEIPANYGVPGQFAEIKVTYDERFQQERAVVSTILGQVTDAVFKEVAQVPGEFRVENSIGISESFITGQGQPIQVSGRAASTQGDSDRCVALSRGSVDHKGNRRRTPDLRARNCRSSCTRS